MATIKTNDGKGTEVIITGPEALNDVKNMNLSDKQIDNTLAQAAKDLEREKHALNPHGQALVNDTQVLIDNTRKQELLQKLYNFAYQGQNVVAGGPSADLKDTSRTLLNQVSGIGSSMHTDVTDVSSYIRSSLYNYLTSSEYRELASDFITIVKMLAAEVKDDQKVSKHSSSSHSYGAHGGQFNQHNQSMPMNQMQNQMPMGQMQNQMPMSQMQNQMPHQQGSLPMPPPISGVQPQVPTMQPMHTDIHIQQGFNQPMQTDIHHQSMNQGIMHQQGHNQPMHQQGHTQPMHGMSGQSHHGSSMDMESRRRDLEEREVADIERRLGHFLERLGEKKEYQTLVENFFTYSDQFYDVLIDVTEKSKQTPEAQQVRALIDQAFELLSEFVGKKLTYVYRQDMINFFTQIKQDKELSAWRKQVRVYVLEQLKNPEIDEQDRNVEQVKVLIREGRRVLRKYKKPINILYEDQAKIARKIRNDPDLQEFQRNLSTLGTHLVCNESGQFDPMVMQESMGQITKLLANLFHRYLSNIPLEKIEVYSPKYDVVLSDIKVSGTGFAPDRIHVGTSSDSTFSFIKSERSRSSMRLSFSVDSINPAFKNFSYHVTKKSFPHFEDHGLATVQMLEGGLGVRVVLKIKSQRGDLPAKASLYSLDTTLSKLKVTVEKSNDHKILAPMVAPLCAKTLQTRLQTAIDSSLRSRFDDIIIQLNKWFASHPMDRAIQSTAGVAQKVLPGSTGHAHTSHSSHSHTTHAHDGKHHGVGEKVKAKAQEKKVKAEVAHDHHDSKTHVDKHKQVY